VVRDGYVDVGVSDALAPSALGASEELAGGAWVESRHPGTCDTAHTREFPCVTAPKPIDFLAVTEYDGYMVGDWSGRTGGRQ